MWRRGAGGGAGTGRGTANTNIRLIWCLHKESESYSGVYIMKVKVILVSAPRNPCTYYRMSKRYESVNLSKWGIKMWTCI